MSSVTAAEAPRTSAGPDPTCSAPGRPRRREISAEFIRSLRADYGPGRTTEAGEPIGDHPAVVAWLASLEARHGR